MDPSYNNLGGMNPGGTNPGASGGATGGGGTGAVTGGVSIAAGVSGGGVPGVGVSGGGAPVTGVGGDVPTGASVGSGVPSGVPVGGNVPPAGQNGFMGNGMSPMGPSEPISSGTGEIVLGGDGGAGRGSRKGVIVLIVLVVLLALVGGGFLLWQNGMSGGNNDNGNAISDKPSANLKTNLKRVINYMYSGIQSEDDLEEIPNDAEFKFESVFYSGNVADRTGFFGTAIDLQNEAMDTLLSNESDTASGYNTLLTDINTRLNRVSTVAMINDVTLENYKEALASTGTAMGLNAVIEERYGGLLNNDDEFLKEYGQAYIDFLTMRTSELELIAQSDCIKYISNLEELDGLETCPNFTQIISQIETLENTNGKLGYTPDMEKGRADDIIDDDIGRMVDDYKQLNEALK